MSAHLCIICTECSKLNIKRVFLFEKYAKPGKTLNGIVFVVYNIYKKN